MGDDGDELEGEKLRAIQEELKDKEDELEYLDALNQNLTLNERRCNDELLEARKELTDVFKENFSRASTGVKRMGELDSKAFIPRDANGHPLKIVPVGNGKTDKVIYIRPSSKS
ncbi:hypothetical protein OROHE_011504 [Orobanche hederae]